MPKGSKTRTTGYTTFHHCPCGFDIEDSSNKLIEMKKKLHRKKCNEWKDANIANLNLGRIDLPVGKNGHHINKETYLNDI
jgi:hypothetical protein